MGQFNEGRESPGALIGQLVCRSERQSVETEVCAADGTGHSGRRINIAADLNRGANCRPVIFRRSEEGVAKHARNDEG